MCYTSARLCTTKTKVHHYDTITVVILEYIIIVIDAFSHSVAL